MATLYTHKSENVRKTWTLIVLFLVVVIGIGYVLSMYYKNPLIFTVAILFSVVMNVVSFWYSDVIALRIAHAMPATEAEFPELHRMVENLAITAGLPKPALYIIPDHAPNAFATGRNAKHASIALTEGLLALLDRSELEGVLAHEMSHIGNNDILLQSMVAILVGFVSIVADMLTRSMLWGGFGGGRSRDEEGNGNSVIIIIGIIFIIISPIIAMLIQLAISRKREYLADASGALLTRYPEGLASALQKISTYQSPMLYASDATAHLYISSPFGGTGATSVRSRIAQLFMTHPPTEKRIAALLNK